MFKFLKFAFLPVSSACRDAAAINHEIVDNTRAGLRDLREQWTVDRNPNRPDAPDLRDFRQVLACWRIAPADVDLAARYYLRSAISICAAGLFVATAYFLHIAAAGEAASWFDRVMPFWMAAVGLIVGAVNLWRYLVLRRRKFVFFYEWIMAPWRWEFSGQDRSGGNHGRQ